MSKEAIVAQLKDTIDRAKAVLAQIDEDMAFAQRKAEEQRTHTRSIIESAEAALADIEALAL